MGETSQRRMCIECGEPVDENEHYLILSSPDGRQHVVHGACFAATTFDPDRYSVSEPPPSGGSR